MMRTKNKNFHKIKKSKLDMETVVIDDAKDYYIAAIVKKHEKTGMTKDKVNVVVRDLFSLFKE